MRLEYQITHLLHPHYEEGRGCVYDHVNWTVWFSRQDLMDDVNKEFGTEFKLEKKTEVDESLAYDIWHFLSKRNDTIGLFGDDYDRNILDIYNDDDTNRSW